MRRQETKAATEAKTPAEVIQMLKKIDTVYIDHEYAEEYPGYIPCTHEELRRIESNTGPWRLFIKTEPANKGIDHLVVFGSDRK